MGDVKALINQLFGIENFFFFFFETIKFWVRSRPGWQISDKTLSDEPCTRAPGDRQYVGGDPGSSADEFVTLIPGWGGRWKLHF